MVCNAYIQSLRKDDVFAEITVISLMEAKSNPYASSVAELIGCFPTYMILNDLKIFLVLNTCH